MSCSSSPANADLLSQRKPVLHRPNLSITASTPRRKSYRNPDFGALARVFGAYGEQVTHPADLEGALRRALDSNRPAVVDVIIDQETLGPVLYKP